MYLGILGGFSGSVGTVVGSTNKKGDDIIRAKSKKTRTSNSEAQVNQRTKFALVTQFLQMLNFLLRIGFKSVADIAGMSAYNYASKMALNDAIVGTAPDFELDYSKVLISKGGLGRMKTGTAAIVAGDVSIQWVNNEKGIGDLTDNAVLLVYNANNFELSYSIGDLTRGSLGGTLPIPNAEIGDKLLVYLFFQSASEQALVSTSQFLGSLIVSE